MMSIKNNILLNNWKVEELLSNGYSVDTIKESSQGYEEDFINLLKLPKKINDILSIHGTNIEWMKMPDYYKFWEDDFEEEDIIRNIKESKITKYDKIIMTFGWNEQVAIIPNELFLENPLEYFYAKRWEGFILTEDYKYFIEISHDYYIHSNFEIMPNSSVWVA